MTAKKPQTGLAYGFLGGTASQLVVKPICSGFGWVVSEGAEDFFADRTGGESVQHVGGEAFVLAGQGQQDVFGADVVAAEDEGFMPGEFERPLGMRRERNVPVEKLVAPWPPPRTNWRTLSWRTFRDARTRVASTGPEAALPSRVRASRRCSVPM